MSSVRKLGSPPAPGKWQAPVGGSTGDYPSAMGPEIPGTLQLVSPSGTAVIEQHVGHAVWDLKAGKQAVVYQEPRSRWTLISPDGKTVALYFEESNRLFDVAGVKSGSRSRGSGATSGPTAWPFLRTGACSSAPRTSRPSRPGT